MGYSNWTICDLIDHLHTLWCKIQKQDKINAKAALRMPLADTFNRHITKYTQELTCSANAAITIGVPCPDNEKVMIFVENIYASSHFTEIELVACENQGAAAQVWAPTVQYFTKLYANCLVFQNRDAGEKPYKSAAQVKIMTLPSYCGSTNSLTDTSLATTEQ